MAKVCIYCKKELDGKDLKGAKKVKDDIVIESIRKVKKALKLAKNYELYVCAEDIEKHKKKRKEFETNMILVGVFAVIVFLGLAFLPVLSAGEFRPASFIAGLMVAVLLILLAGFLKYTPALGE